MRFNFRKKQVEEKKIPKPKPREEKKCEIEIKKTKTGKKISWSGNCSREHLSAFAKQNNIDLEE